jgi:hypothetical protein
VKPSVDREATRQLLADIADAVRPVELARTAAAVERALRTASPSVFQLATGAFLAQPILDELGLQRPRHGCGEGCGCEDDTIEPDDLPGLSMQFLVVGSNLTEQQSRYAPWVVSPHLFPEVAP